MKKNFGVLSVLAVAFVVVIIFILMVNMGIVHAEEEEEYLTVYVTGSDVNARMSPNKQSGVMTVLEKGQNIEITGKWSKDHRWIEIHHPECGRLWCDYHYFTERQDTFTVETLWDEPVKIRKQVFNGRVTGYLRKGKTVEITQVILGWGKCKQGWIDMEYCIEICE